jgi:hypothetical protein
VSKRHEPRAGGKQLRLDLLRGATDGASRPNDSPRRSSAPIEEGGLADRIADQGLARLAPRFSVQPPSTDSDLLDAGQVARLLGVDRGWVYQHKSELGAIALGHGARPRLRFDRAKVDALLRSAEDAAPSPRAGRRRRRRSPGAETVRLLEVKGRAP